jgi:hypothetical protein
MRRRRCPGGYILRWQDFWIRDRVQPVAHYRLPLSEGIVDKRYARVGTHLLRSALRTEPYLFCLGMGGMDRPLPQMLKALRWELHEVPFYFRVLRGKPFLREIRPLRSSLPRRIALELAAHSGLGHLALRTLHLAQGWRHHIRGSDRTPDRSDRRAHRDTAEIDEVSGFDAWADDLWQRTRRHYAVCGVRDSETLNLLYPPADSRFIRLRLMRDGFAVGWVVLLDTPMSGHKQFGNMRVATLVDGLAETPFLDEIIAAATRTLERRGADLVISNQSHIDWRGALDRQGFLRGPSNYIFAASPKLAKLMDPLEESLDRLHITRGDGDGPIHL